VQAIAAEPDINSVYVLDEKLEHLIAGDTYLWDSEGNAEIARIGQQVIQSQIAYGEIDEDDEDQYVMATPVLLPMESNARQLRPDRRDHHHWAWTSHWDGANPCPRRSGLAQLQ
jgi:hypothetical protein